MMWTSSTPASAARSSTASITRWRMSGRRMGGSGREMSSNAIVSFIPGNSSAGSGSASIGFEQRATDGGVGMCERCERLGRIDDAGPVGRQLLEAELLAVVEQHGRGGAVDVEDEPGAGSRASRRARAVASDERARRGEPRAWGGGRWGSTSVPFLSVGCEVEGDLDRAAAAGRRRHVRCASV